MKIKTLLLLTILISIAFISRGQYMMMTVDGIKQGKFKGESTRSGAAEKIELLYFSQEIVSPRDAASGMPTGKRMHRPITIRKMTGSSSPQFFTALVSNEVLRTVTIEFYKKDDIYTSSSEMLFYKIELTNASVSRFRQFMGASEAAGPKARPEDLTEEIEFTFEKIKVTCTKGSTSGADDWRVSN